jgi:hypothetical protein
MAAVSFRDAGGTGAGANAKQHRIVSGAARVSLVLSIPMKLLQRAGEGGEVIVRAIQQVGEHIPNRAFARNFSASLRSAMSACSISTPTASASSNDLLPSATSSS